MCGGGGGGSERTEQHSTSEPWEGLQPHLRELYQGASDQFKQGDLQYFPGSTIAGFNPTQQGAQQGILGLAGQPNPLASAATGAVQSAATGQSPVLGGFDPSSPEFDYLQNVASGGMLNANPYVDQMYQSASQPIIDQFRTQVLPSVSGQFMASGRSGSPMQGLATGQAVEGLGRTLGDLSSNIYGQNYARERQAQDAAATSLGSAYRQEGALLDSAFRGQTENQLRAAAIAPGVDALRYAGLERALGIGGQQQQMSQAQINEAIQRHNFDQLAPWQQLQLYGDILAGQPAANAAGASMASGTTPTYGSGGAGIAGGALSGAAMGSVLGPWGAAGGAVIGGLLGAYG